MQNTPTITVVARLLVHKAIIRVGIMAIRTFQSIEMNESFSTIKLSVINAAKMQIGIYESHLNTTLGSLTFRTTINGIILGMAVTKAQPKIISNIDNVVLICLSSLQWLQQLLLIKL